MLSEISANTINAAHELNIRDSKIADAVNAGKPAKDAREDFPDDGQIFVESGDAEQSSGSSKIVGPYPISGLR
jgi:hypothetical protein